MEFRGDFYQIGVVVRDTTSVGLITQTIDRDFRAGARL